MINKRRMFSFQAPPLQVIETEEESTRRLGKQTFFSCTFALGY